MRTGWKVVECACLIVSLKLSRGNFRSLCILGMLVVATKKMEMEQSIHHHGAGPVCWRASGVDVYGKYNFGYEIDCMLNEVRQQVIECACVMGPCRRTLS